VKPTTPLPVDESEEDIQAVGATPPPPIKPANFYNTPHMPFGVKLNRNFGYNPF
jgi:hypothetical protein